MVDSMAVEDEDLRDREIWTAVSRHWYSKASDEAPSTGRLYHHLAILGRPRAAEQLFYFTKALCVSVPLISARRSIRRSIRSLGQAQGETSGPPWLVQIWLKRYQTVQGLLAALDVRLGTSTCCRWMETGYQIAMSNLNAVVGYDENNPTQPHLLGKSHYVSGVGGNEAIPQSTRQRLEDTVSTPPRAVKMISRGTGDSNIYQYLHVALVFFRYLASPKAAIRHLETTFPWKLLATMLNTLVISSKSFEPLEATDFPRSPPRPLPEEYAMRGLLWAKGYFPGGLFNFANIDDDERYFEAPSMTEERKETILQLADLINCRGGIIPDPNGMHLPLRGRWREDGSRGTGRRRPNVSRLANLLCRLRSSILSGLFASPRFMKCGMKRTSEETR